MKEERIEVCNICKNEFDIYKKDNSGYVGEEGNPICKICCEELSI